MDGKTEEHTNEESGFVTSSLPNTTAVDVQPVGADVSKWVKLTLLVVLCLQNAVYSLLRRYRYGQRALHPSSFFSPIPVLWNRSRMQIVQRQIFPCCWPFS